MLIYLLFIIVLPVMVFSSEPQVIPFQIPSDLVQGGKVKLMCSVSKGSHPIKFEWLFNGHNVYETNDIFVQNLDDASILNIKNLKLIHNTNVSCVATNRFGKDVYTSKLTVTAAPQWIKKPPEILKIKETESVSLDCVANGHPIPKIVWTKILTKNSKDNSEQQIKSLQNGTLQLNFIAQSDEGEYVCTVDNKIGEKLTSKTMIVVQSAAKVIMFDNYGKELITNTNEIPTNYAKKGEELSIRCAGTGDPPLTIDWFKNQELMQYKFKSNMETLNSLTASGILSELHFRSVERDDGGVYECVIKNFLGESKKSQKLIVLEPPEAPRNIKISDLDSNSVRVDWQLSFNGNLDLIKINIYYWESNKKQTGNHKLNKVEVDLASSTWHVLKSLKSGQSYNIALTCENSAGESILSEPVQFETKMKNPMNPPTDLTIEKVFGNKILISWKYSKISRSANVTGFQVFYKPIDEQNYFIERVTIKDNEMEANEQLHLTLINLKKNTKYLIKVKALNKEGYSPDSEEIECSTLRGNLPNPPRIVQHQVHSKSYLIVKWEHSNAPINPTLNAALRHEESNDHQQQLVPKTSSSDDSDLQDFDNSVQFFMAYVEVSDLHMIVQTIPITASMRQVTIANLDKDIQYNIYISASNNYGESEYSEPLIVTIRSYQYEMGIFMVERNALIVTAISIAVSAILVSIICSIIYMKKFQLAQQEKLRKMSTLTLSKCGTNKTTATYDTIRTNAQSTGLTNYNAQQLTPINTAAYLTNQQPSTSSNYQEIGLTYDLAIGGLTNAHQMPKSALIQTPRHLTTFGHVTISSDRSSDNEDQIIQIKDRFRQSNKSLDSKNMRISYDECIYDDALG